MMFKKHFALPVFIVVLVVCFSLLSLYKDCNWHNASDTCVRAAPKPYQVLELSGGVIEVSASTTVVISSPSLKPSPLSIEPSLEASTSMYVLLQTNAEETVPPSESNFDNISMSLDVDERAEWQQQQVERYCESHSTRELLRNNILPDRHLIYDDQRKFIFYYVPKAGCTPAKRMIFLLQKKIPANVTDQKLLSRYMEKVIYSSSFASKSMNRNPIARKKRLEEYFKFTILRNPIERLLSGFLDKIAPQMNYSLVRKKRWPDSVRADILRTYRKEEFHQWNLAKGATELVVSFKEFIQWYVASSKHRLNPHFASFINLAKPCLIKYDFYVTFKLYNSDMLELTKRFGGTPDMLWTEGHNRKDSQSHLEEYYGSLSAGLKRKLHAVMREDLDFYHLLQPEDRAYNEKLLSA